MAVRDTIARIKLNNKHFEIVVNLDAALNVRKGTSKDIAGTLLANQVYYDSKKGLLASKEDLEKAFATSDIFAVAERIIKKGEVQLPKEFRDEERENKKKKVIEWYVKNAVDSRSGRPFTPDMISSAIDQAGINIDNKPLEQQISKITESLGKILPIKVETKKLMITLPAVYTGKAYGVVSEYKEKEDWLSNGDLKVTINIPVGLQSEFYDKLNSITHGAALTEEVKIK